jgi:predicted acyl esterase
MASSRNDPPAVALRIGTLLQMDFPVEQDCFPDVQEHASHSAQSSGSFSVWEDNMRRDIEFTTEDGVTLRGWHYAAKGVVGPAPTVIMAHGFSATREIFLDRFADVF